MKPKNSSVMPRGKRGLGVLAMCMASAAMMHSSGALAVQCDRTITANVVVFDSPTVFNRLGAQNPNFISYALERDVIHFDRGNPQDSDNGKPCSQIQGGCRAGQVELRPDKRPRPLVVRSVEGSCLTVNFTNLLHPRANPNDNAAGPDGILGTADDDPRINPLLLNNDQVADRCAGFHASGVELLESINSDGSLVGKNPGAQGAGARAICGEGTLKGGLVGPGASITYKLYTPKEGTFVVNSYGATIGSESSAGNLGMGMFAQLNVQPKGARMYRSQMTEEEMRLATVDTVPSDCTAGQVVGVDCNPGGQPIIDYEAKYPNVEPWISEGKAGLPIINMLTASNELVHADINAIIAGPNPDGSFPPSTYPLESVGKNVPSYPNRLEPFREFASIYHDEVATAQVFPRWYADPVLQYTLAGVKDAFMINYGSGGIGSEIISNRLRTGPMHDCTDCAYEEFFLASQTVGDPAMLVQFPANTGIEQCDPSAIAGASCWRDPVNLVNGPIAGNYALYQEDPSNVHHSYVGDAIKMRNIHAGAHEQHIHHMHNVQWLQNPNDDNSNYLDAQEILPGSGHTYELTNGGAGNRNKTSGDAIYHCHFYPHFAQGMWYHIRIHDVMEVGTKLAVSETATGFHDNPFDLRSGKPAAGSRALPDGELPDGSPIPAIVPLPGKAMPQMPAKVHVIAVDRGGANVLGRLSGPDGIFDSAQAVVDRSSVAGADGVLGTADDVSPGFPFWLAGNECGTPTADDICPQGIVGQRMPTPPLDMLTEVGAENAGYNPAQAGGWDGGLPRHALRGYTSGGLSKDTNSRLDLSKIVELAQPVYYPEVGTDMEQVSMAYQAVRNRPSAANNLADNGFTLGSFVLNGAPPVPGGPFNDPCVDDTGAPLMSGVPGSWFDGDGDPNTLNTKGGSVFGSDSPRTYKVANIQIDAVFNKMGYHYPQERIISLWEDVAPHILKQRPPEPLVMRFNTFECGKILHANLVPAEFELDDFQVRTPTDIIGQHIHLPKWDLTTNDGAANGWNYEDGTLSPQMVVERILAINRFNELAAACVADPAACIVPAGTVPGQLQDINLTGLAPVATIDTGDIGGTPAGLTFLTAQPHPYFGLGVAGQDYLGARTTIQRIMMDPVVNVAGVDRGLGMTFSHDHYGPSTFQQIGLYSTILAEPAGSTWVHNETGELMGTRSDGGPTSWQAAILPPETAPVGSTVGSENIADHREFYFEMSDFQHAYQPGVYVGANALGITSFLDPLTGTKTSAQGCTFGPCKNDIVQNDPFNATQATAPAIQNAWEEAINPPLKLKSVPFPDVVTAKGVCPGPDGAGGITNASPMVPRPCPEAINISHSSMWVVNYRNEPVGLRVYDPNAMGPDGTKGSQAAGDAGDLALAFQSRTDRAIPQLNTSMGDSPYPLAAHCGARAGNDYEDDRGRDFRRSLRRTQGDGINCDRRPGDPFTPIMRAYERDEVKVKIQVGATEEQHQVTIHGMKWLSNGSGFGRAPNSGWRNFQAHGISEQFSLQSPMNPDPNQRGNTVDYLYATDATRDGVWSGTWGILRTYGRLRDDLFTLPDNSNVEMAAVINEAEFSGVCPVNAPVKKFDVTVALANDILPNNLGVTIPSNNQVRDDGDRRSKGRRGRGNEDRGRGRGRGGLGEFLGGDSDGDGLGDNVGGPLDPNGGTLVYNRRGTVVPSLTVEGDGGVLETLRGGEGPLNDPTAMMYVMTSDLMEDPSNRRDKRACINGGVNNTSCPVMLKPDAPVEPIVLRANAGDCIKVVLRNRLPERAPDLAGWQDGMWVVTRQLQDVPLLDDLGNAVLDANGNAVMTREMRFFNNNLVRPSSKAGMHPQLVEYDMSRDDGVVVGKNRGRTVAGPGEVVRYKWYAGDLHHEKNGDNVTIVATPVEFGATNLVSADRYKQPQKGLFGSLVIEPQGATVAEDTQVWDGQGTGTMTRNTRAQVTVTAPVGGAGSGGSYREALSIGHKITNLRWKDGTAISNIHQGQLGRQGAEDSGHGGFNYGAEPSWFRFHLPPDVPFGNAGTPNSFGSVPNAHAMYANGLVENEPNTLPGGDPVTPVYTAAPGQATRMYVLNGASADRGGTFVLHGHLWQREPYVCPDEADLGLVGRCGPDTLVGSLALGHNPHEKYMGGQEGMGHVFSHWPILFDAGGSAAIPGDYLYRDYMPSGNRNGQFGILRVE